MYQLSDICFFLKFLLIALKTLLQRCTQGGNYLEQTTFSSSSLEIFNVSYGTVDLT